VLFEGPLHGLQTVEGGEGRGRWQRGQGRDQQP
jgi:hypothetical protein